VDVDIGAELVPIGLVDLAVAVVIEPVADLGIRLAVAQHAVKAERSAEAIPDLLAAIDGAGHVEVARARLAPAAPPLGQAVSVRARVPIWTGGPVLAGQHTHALLAQGVTASALGYAAVAVVEAGQAQHVDHRDATPGVGGHETWIARRREADRRLVDELARGRDDVGQVRTTGSVAGATVVIVDIPAHLVHPGLVDLAVEVVVHAIADLGLRLDDISLDRSIVDGGLCSTSRERHDDRAER